MLLAVCLLTALYLVAMVAALDRYQEMLEGMLTLIYVIPRYVICGMALRVNTPSLDTWGKRGKCITTGKPNQLQFYTFVKPTYPTYEHTSMNKSLHLNLQMLSAKVMKWFSPTVF